MSSVELEDLPQALKEKVRDVLNPYFTKHYRDDVKNPVLLLNFLHQHSIIPRPAYDICEDPNKPFHFIGSCSLGPFNLEDHNVTCAVGPLKVEVEASSKKKCKKKAAQMILNLFLEDEEMEVMNYCDDQEYQIDLGINSITIEDSSSEFSLEDRYFYKPEPMKNTGNFYEDDLSGILSFDDINLDNKTTSCDSGRRKSTAVYYAEPQCGKEWALNSSARVESTKSVPSKYKMENDISNKDTKVDNSAIQPKSTSLDMSRPIEEQNASSEKPKSQSNSFAPKQLSWKKKTDSSSSLSSQSSNQSLDDQRMLQNEKSFVSDKLFVDFFDPFSRLRPKINGQMNGIRKESALNVGKASTSSETTSCEAQPKFPVELSQSNKTPFQILQEKAVKNFKLIPRSRIEKTDNGFSCTIILNAKTGSGEGRTKKEAKLKAATCLLQLI